MLRSRGRVQVRSAVRSLCGEQGRGKCREPSCLHARDCRRRHILTTAFAVFPACRATRLRNARRSLRAIRACASRQVGACRPCNALQTQFAQGKPHIVEAHASHVSASGVSVCLDALLLYSLNLSSGYCDNAWDQRNLLRPMSSGLLAPDVNAVEMSTCTIMLCSPL